MRMTAIFQFFLLIFFVPEIANAESHSKHDRIMERYQSNWSRLIPRQTKLQFAGSMGMFSSGPGWFYGKRNQWETDFYIGFIPKINGNKGHVTTTLKQTYTPFRVQLNDRFAFEPLTGGIYISKIFGEYFWSRLPEKYPENYYFWAVNTRFHIFMGEAISLKLKEKMIGNEVAFFYEFNTNDLYLISAIQNKTIGLKDIVSLSFGLRYRFF